MQLKSKAWGVIKLFNVLDGLSKKTYQAENKNSKVK
jgi:hypothetical protein